MKTVEELNEKLDSIEQYVSQIETNISTEQIAYNNELTSIIEDLTNYENYIKEAMSKKIKNTKGKKDISLISLESDIESLKEIMLYTSDEDKCLNATGLDKILYKISYSKDVDIVNKNILDFLNILKSYGVNITCDMHDFSYYTDKYMRKLYENKDASDFYIKMKKYFEEIYWVCPNIIKQLVINFLNIFEKNKKVIYKSVVNRRNSLISGIDLVNDSVIDTFNIRINSLHDTQNKDTFYLFDYFTNNSDVLNKFLSYKYDDIFNKYSKSNLEDNEYEVFINNIKSFRSNLIEYINLKRFNYILEYESNILNKKDKTEKVNKKELSKLLKKKDSINSKIVKLNFKKDKNKESNSNNDMIDKKIRINNAYLINCADEIYKLTIKNFVNEFTSEVEAKLSESSNIYDALMIAKKNYLALANYIYESSLAMDICDEIDELEDFLYSKDLFISHNTALNYLNGISELIEKKYILCNIKAELDYENIDLLNDIVDELFFLQISYNLKLKNLTLKDIEVCVRRTNE